METAHHLKNKLHALPKIELHIHLEGCISLSTLKFLAKKNNIVLPAHLAENAKINFSNFDEFVQTFYAICNVITTEADFKFIAKDLVAYVKRNTIIYCEVSFTPVIYMNRGFSFSKIMGILNEEIALNNLITNIYFIIDTQRDHGTAVGEQVFNNVVATKDCNIVGIGMTGQEVGFLASDYAALYKKMYDKGYGLAAHAGEYGGANDIWQCLLHLKVKRIGHGIRAITDKELLEYIKSNDIHLEVSPTSNIRLCRVDSYAVHPVKDFINMGLNVGINSDDPGIFDTDISDEYANMLDAFNFDTNVLKQCNVNAVNAAFTSGQTQQNLLTVIKQYW